MGLAVGLVLAGCKGSGTAPNPPLGALKHLYVANAGNNEINVFSSNASSSSTPTNTISGGSTGLDDPHDIAFDGSGNMYVTTNDNCSASAESVLVYAAGATGDATPTATINGSGTGMSNATGVAIDSSGRIYVANECNATITVYAAGATGDATPVNTLSTDLDCPHGLAISGGALYATDECNDEIYIYSSSSGYATSNVAPTTTIVGGGTQLDDPHGIAVDGSGTMYVANANAPSVLIFSATASGDAMPTVISGSSTGLGRPNGIAVYDGKIYVGDIGSDDVLVFSTSASGDMAPEVKITSGLNSPKGVAIH